MTRHRKPVAILGAGIAGVTAAAALRRRGVPVRLYEGGEFRPNLSRLRRKRDCLLV